MSLDQEREMVRQMASKTAQRIQSKAGELDATGQFPWDLIETFGKQGFLSILLPEEYGGTNGDLLSFCLVIEEIAKVCGSSSMLILGQGLGTNPILIGGNSIQKEHYFTQISEKNSLIAFAFCEPEIGLDLTSIKTRAEKRGGEYLINGHKGFVINGSVAHYYTIFAITDPRRGKEGITGFVVDSGTAGLQFGEKVEKIGMRGSVTTDLILENCKVPEENRLGEKEEGWKIALNTINLSRPAVGAQAVGLAQGALDYAIGYATERIQFNKPISSFQAIQFMIADMATQIEAARALVYKAVDQIMAKHPNSERLSAIAKIFASDVAMKVTTDAVQILGGYGYMKDYPLERMMRDAKVTQVYEGANQVQRLVVAQQLFK